MNMKNLKFLFLLILIGFFGCNNPKNESIDDLGESLTELIFGYSRNLPRLFVLDKEWSEIVNQSTFTNEQKIKIKDEINFSYYRTIGSTDVVGVWRLNFMDELDKKSIYKGHEKIKFKNIKYDNITSKYGITFCQNVIVNFTVDEREFSIYIDVCIKTNDGWKILYRPELNQILPRDPKSFVDYVFECLNGGLFNAGAKLNDDDFNFILPNLFDIFSIDNEKIASEMIDDYYKKHTNTVYDHKLSKLKGGLELGSTIKNWKDISNVNIQQNGNGFTNNILVSFVYNNNNYQITYNNCILTNRCFVLFGDIDFIKQN